MSEIEELAAQIELLERTVAELKAERAELAAIVDAIKATVLESIVLPKLGT